MQKCLQWTTNWEETKKNDRNDEIAEGQKETRTTWGVSPEKQEWLLVVSGNERPRDRRTVGFGTSIRLSAGAEHLGDMGWWEFKESICCEKSVDYRESGFVLNQDFVIGHSLFENWGI